MVKRLKQYSGYVVSFACIAIVVLSTVLFPEPTVALGSDIANQNQAFAGDSGASFTLTDDPRLIVARLIRTAFAIVGTLFLIYATMGGYKYFFSRGDEGQIKEAKSTILTAVIGVLLMLSAYSLTTFIIDRLIRSTMDNSGWSTERGPEMRDTNDPYARPPRPGLEW